MKTSKFLSAILAVLLMNGVMFAADELTLNATVNSYAVLGFESVSGETTENEVYRVKPKSIDIDAIDAGSAITKSNSIFVKSNIPISITISGTAALVHSTDGTVTLATTYTLFESAYTLGNTVDVPGVASDGTTSVGTFVVSTAETATTQKPGTYTQTLSVAIEVR